MDKTTTPALRDRILQECQGMARYAFASGLSVPPSIVQMIEAFATRSSQDADIPSEVARQNMLSRTGR